MLSILFSATDLSVSAGEIGMGFMICYCSLSMINYLHFGHNGQGASCTKQKLQIGVGRKKILKTQMDPY